MSRMFGYSPISGGFGSFQSAASSEFELFNQDISSWDVSNVTQMASMFLRNFRFNQDISSWDVSNVITMSYMFYTYNGYGYLPQDFSNWNVTNVTSCNNFDDYRTQFTPPTFTNCTP